MWCIIPTDEALVQSDLDDNGKRSSSTRKGQSFCRAQIGWYLCAKYVVLAVLYAYARAIAPILANWSCPVVGMDMDGILVVLREIWFDNRVVSGVLMAGLA